MAMESMVVAEAVAVVAIMVIELENLATALRARMMDQMKMSLTMSVAVKVIVQMFSPQKARPRTRLTLLRMPPRKLPRARRRPNLRTRMHFLPILKRHGILSNLRMILHQLPRSTVLIWMMPV